MVLIPRVGKRYCYDPNPDNNPIANMRTVQQKFTYTKILTISLTAVS